MVWSLTLPQKSKPIGEQISHADISAKILYIKSELVRIDGINPGMEVGDGLEIIIKSNDSERDTGLLYKAMKVMRIEEYKHKKIREYLPANYFKSKNPRLTLPRDDF